MAFRFDDRGWYDGEVPDGSPRSTGEAPPITSTTTTPGEERANWSGLAWVTAPYSAPPGPDLDALRAAHWDSIKAERDRRTLAGGYVVSVEGNPKWFHSDLLSRSQQIGLVLLGASIPPGLAWKTMDGSFVSMTQALAGAIFAAAAQQDQATFAAAEAARTVMDADPQSFDLASVVWPATYGGAL